MEEWITNILSSSLVATLLGVFLYLVDKRHMADKKELKEIIRERDVTIVMKDAALKEQTEEIKEFLHGNTILETRILDALKFKNDGK